ncbi:transposase [Paracoccus sp. MC1854]|uniref:transposase n=1 Tax=Paracoccus sp. MC1854 TaxID=2760306 RepID=UPI0015FF9F87|nr:transposase [Paracoccus sp. MC1854]MBB1493173.1 transposase [Paracoccus sp. MC1854]
MERARAAGLVDPAPVAAVDATGLETRHMSAYFGLRRAGSGHRQRAWPKLTAVVHVASHLIVGAVPGVGPSQDSPDFIPAMRQAAKLIAFDTALADAGYDAEHNHRLCRDELGLRRTVIALNPRNTGDRSPKEAYRRALWGDFPAALYHQRWHAESAFSQHKRRLGSALTTRGENAQQQELALRVITHNLVLLPRAK